MATMTVSEYAGAIKDTVVSFWHGLSITLSHLARRPMTVQYPDRTPMAVRDMLPPRYRGFLEVDTAICTGCQACERACPIGCIQITLEKDPTNPKQRVVTQFDIDEAKCMFCGLCVEPCPTGSIQHTREFEGSHRNIRNLVFRWADPEAPFPVYKVDKNAEYYPRVQLGSLVRLRLETLRLGPRRADVPAARAAEAARGEGRREARARGEAGRSGRREARGRGSGDRSGRGEARPGARTRCRPGSCRGRACCRCRPSCRPGSCRRRACCRSRGSRGGARGTRGREAPDPREQVRPRR